jgi:hypothetical protein
MAAHEHRAHATWAASATARHLACPGSLALALSLPRTERVEREAAAWGTCAHQIAERCLRTAVDAGIYVGDEEESGRFTFTVDEEMANTAQVYVDYCRGLMDRAANWWIEENFSLAALDPPFDSGGTADFTAFLEDEKMLEIVDLKGGKGVVVDVHENEQLRTYALGAMLAHPGLDIDRVCVTIIQPRAPHKDGIIRSEIFTVGELLEWTGDLLRGMHHSDEALDALAKANGNQVLLDEWRDKYLKPGKCQFCPAEGVCPALRNDAMSIAAKWFDTNPDTGEMTQSNAVLDTSPEALARDLDMMDLLTNWMNARRAYAQQLAEGGTEIPGYQLVDKRGTRRWIEQDEKRAAVAIAKTLNLDAADLFNTKLKSPAQVEKLIPSTAKKKLTPLWEMHVSGTNLVRSDKTNRPAVGSLAHRYFEPPMEDL